MKFHTIQNPKLVKRTNLTSTSSVQSGLVPKLRNIVTNPNGYYPSIGFSPLDNDTIPPAYDNLSYTERLKKLENLQRWFDENKDTLLSASQKESVQVQQKESDQVQDVPSE